MWVKHGKTIINYPWLGMVVYTTHKNGDFMVMTGGWFNRWRRPPPLRCFCHRLPQVVWPGIPRGSPCQGQVLPPQMGWQKVVKIHENPADFKAIERCSTTFLDLFCWWLLTKYIGLLGVALAYILKVDRKICGFPSAPGSLAKSLVLWLMPTGSNKGYQIINESTKDVLICEIEKDDMI